MSITHLHKLCEEYIETISKGLKPRQKAGRGTKTQPHWPKLFYREMWKAFYSEIKKQLKPRYRNSLDRRIDPENALKTIRLLDTLPLFPFRIDQGSLRKYNDKYERIDAVLTRIFMHVTGIGEKAKTEESKFKAFYRLINSPQKP